MAVTSTNVKGNNTKFFIYLNWKFTPDAPSFSTLTTTNDKTSITVNATVSAPTTGTFRVDQIRGGRTDSYNSWSANAVNSVKENVSGSANTRTNCTVYFNKSGTAMGSRHAWGNVARNFTGIATGTGKYVNIAVTKSDSDTCNGKYFNAKFNLATTQSIEYSMDNSTFQSSSTFTGLTPNTTYTFYVRSRATSSTSDNSGYVYDSVEGTTTGTPPSYDVTAGSISRTWFVLTPSNIVYDTGADFSSIEFFWGTTTSYGNSALNQHSADPETITELTPNTLYYWKTTLTDTNGLSTDKTGSITTSGNAPTVIASTTPARTSCTLAIGATYDTNASFSSGKYEYGTSTSYGTTVTISGTGNQTISNLSPNTTYYYKVTVTDNWGREGTKTGSFTTTCYAPNDMAIGRGSYGTNSIVINVSATGDTNAPITNYTVYYKLSSASSYTSVNLGTNTSTTLTGLNTDADYNVYFTATNAGGTTSSSTITVSTSLPNPTISSATASAITKTSFTITVNASISPSRTLSYRFSNDDGSTYTAYQSGNSYTFTGLNPGTSYLVEVCVKATHTATASYTSDTLAYYGSFTVTTLPAQATISLKQNGAWTSGGVFIKVNNSWVEAEKVYIKVNGAWKEANN